MAASNETRTETPDIIPHGLSNPQLARASQTVCDPAFVNNADRSSPDVDKALQRIKDALDGGSAALPSDVLAILNHFLLGHGTAGNLRSNIVANSAFSVVNFPTSAASITNLISGSTASFAYGTAEQRPPLNGRVRQRLTVTGGESNNRRNIWIWVQKMNAIRSGASNRSGIIGIGTSSNGTHTLINLRSNAAGSGGFFNYSLYGGGGSRQHDFTLDYIFTDDATHGIAGGSREHFYENDIMAMIMKMEEVDANNYRMAMSGVRFDQDMNYTETQHYATSLSTETHNSVTYTPEPFNMLDGSVKIFRGGDADGTSDHEIIAAEGCQYTTSSNVADELHPGSTRVNQGLRHLPNANSALLGEYTTRQTDYLNVNVPLKVSDDDVLTGNKTGERTLIREANVNVLISQRLTASGITIDTTGWNDLDIIEFWSGKDTTHGTNKKVWFKIGEVTVDMWKNAPTTVANTTADFRGNNMNIVTGDHVASVREMIARTTAGEVLYTTQSSDNVEQDANPLRVYRVKGA